MSTSWVVLADIVVDVLTVATAAGVEFVRGFHRFIVDSGWGADGRKASSLSTRLP